MTEPRGKQITQEPPEKPSLGRLLHNALETYHKLLTERVKEAGFSDITPAQAKVIAHMDNSPVKAVDLADRIGISKQAISVMAAELSKKGYIGHQADTKDGRVKRFVLLKRGKDLKAEGENARRHTEDRLLDSFSPDEQLLFVKQLELLNAKRSR